MTEADPTDDQIEAANTRYWTSTIVRLSSGRFALYNPFTDEDDWPVMGIGTLAELEPLIPHAKDVQLYARRQKAADSVSPHDLLISLGLIQPIKRRA
jgi:hypothetical protein